MIEEYLTFNAARFVKDYYRYKKIIPELKKQLDDVVDIKAIPIGQDKVQSSPDKSQVENIILRRVAIQEKIDRYARHCEAYQNAEKRLLPDEKMVLDTFFTASTKTAAIVILENEGISRTTAYNIRKAALDKIASAIAGVSAD